MQTFKPAHNCTSIPCRVCVYVCVVHKQRSRKHKMKTQPVNMTRWPHKQNIIRLYLRSRPSSTARFRIYIFGRVHNLAECTIHHTFGETIRGRSLQCKTLCWMNFICCFLLLLWGTCVGTPTVCLEDMSKERGRTERRRPADSDATASVHSGCYGMSIMSFHTNLTRH